MTQLQIQSIIQNGERKKKYLGFSIIPLMKPKKFYICGEHTNSEIIFTIRQWYLVHINSRNKSQTYPSNFFIHMITDTHTSDVGAFKKTDFKSDHIQDLKITAFKKKSCLLKS